MLQEDDTPELEETPKLRGHPEQLTALSKRSEEETSIRLQPADEKQAISEEEESETHEKMKMIAVSPKRGQNIRPETASIFQGT